MSLECLLADIRVRCREEAQQHRKYRIQAWRSWMEEEWSSQRKRVFNVCSGDKVPPARRFLCPDGSFTAKFEDIDELMRNAWMQVFRKFASVPEPSWDEFRSQFEACIPHCPFDIHCITGEELQQVLAKMSGSPGLDGWRPAELKALPLTLMNALADLFNLIEKSGVWPAALQKATVSWIPQGQGCNPEDMRLLLL